MIKPGVSEAEFYRLAGEDSDWEYLDGRMVMAPVSHRHESVFRFLLTLLSAYVDERGGGMVLGSRYPMRLDERWSPEPDILVVRSERRHLLHPQRLEGPADLVIEIASEADPALDVREKLPRYRAAGIPEMWLIDPFATSLRAESREADGYSTRNLSAGRLDSAVLPGFWLRVEWLWQSDLPSTMRCLREILG